MSSKPTDILSREELDSILQLWAEPQTESRGDIGGWLHIPEGTAGLLLNLPGEPRIELQVSCQGHRLCIPLKPRHRSDSGVLSLEIGVPEILEGDRQARSWRVPPASDAMRLHDGSGELEQSQVLNLSRTGMAVEQRANRVSEMNRQSLRHLRLVLPGQSASVRLLGDVVRRTPLDEGRIQLGIRFAPLTSDAEDRLGRYILRRHQELQAARPGGAEASG